MKTTLALLCACALACGHAPAKPAPPIVARPTHDAIATFDAEVFLAADALDLIRAIESELCQLRHADAIQAIAASSVRHVEGLIV